MSARHTRHIIRDTQLCVKASNDDDISRQGHYMEINIEVGVLSMSRIVSHTIVDKRVKFETVLRVYVEESWQMVKDIKDAYLFIITCINTVEFDCRCAKSSKTNGYGKKEVVGPKKAMHGCYNMLRNVRFIITFIKLI